MTKRYVLAWFVGVGALAGGGLAALPFFAAMSPSERTYAERPHVRIPALRPGEFAFVASPEWGEMDWMFVRRRDGRLNVWMVPMRDGLHMMPDGHWWNGRWCKDFRPLFDKGVIACTDDNLAEWERTVWSWTLDGRVVAEGHGIDDMIPVGGYDEVGFWVRGKPRPRG